MPSAQHISHLRILRLGLLLILAGCGSGASIVTPPAAGTASTLAGNWLLYGALPNAFFGGTQSGFGISFDATGNNLSATASINTTCSNSSSGFGLTVGAGGMMGTVASDGSFTASSGTTSSGQNPAFPVLTVAGKAPPTAGTPWSGTYTLTSNSTTCPVNQSGPFSATPVQDINGTYTGTGTLSTFLSAIPVTMSLTLSQGAPLYPPGAPASGSSRLGIAGSIQIQGFSCFSKGTMSTTTSSEVYGGPFSITFLMDDGSSMMVLGSIGDTAASQLNINLLRVSGGSCSGSYGFGSNGLVVKH
jgi:hypothetical protein